jgi:NDP-sugar pyrophosphorylase family protein
MLPVVILAGGLATRLRPITENIPKSLVVVAKRPFIFHQLEYLKSQGVKTVVICIGYLGEMIREALGDGHSFGLQLLYVSDGPKLLGTGGAIKQALAQNQSILSPAFFVLYGDSFLPIEFEPVYKAFETSSMPSLMTITKNNNLWDSSNVLFKKDKIFEYNKIKPKKKMKHIDYGLSILSSHLFDKYILGANFDLAELFNELSISGQVKGFEVFERFYETGSHSGLIEIADYFSNKDKK